MSEGPIKRERDAWKPPAVSTPDTQRRCADGAQPGRGYCGRKAKSTEKNWPVVSCADCHAARRADMAAGEKNR